MKIKKQKMLEESKMKVSDIQQEEEEEEQQLLEQLQLEFIVIG